MYTLVDRYSTIINNNNACKMIENARWYKMCDFSISKRRNIHRTKHVRDDLESAIYLFLNAKIHTKHVRDDL